MSDGKGAEERPKSLRATARWGKHVLGLLRLWWYVVVRRCCCKPRVPTSVPTASAAQQEVVERLHQLLERRESEASSQGAGCRVQAGLERRESEASSQGAGCRVQAGLERRVSEASSRKLSEASGSQARLYPVPPPRPSSSPTSPGTLYPRLSPTRPSTAAVGAPAADEGSPQEGGAGGAGGEGALIAGGRHSQLARSATALPRVQGTGRRRPEEALPGYRVQGEGAMSSHEAPCTLYPPRRTAPHRHRCTVHSSHCLSKPSPRLSHLTLILHTLALTLAIGYSP